MARKLGALAGAFAGTGIGCAATLVTVVTLHWVTVPKSEAPAKQTGGEAGAPPSVLDAARAAERRRQQDYASRFDREVPEARWAPDVSASLVTDLRAAESKGRFETLSVECRSTICAARLRWQTYSEARSALRAVVVLGYTSMARCKREVFLPDPQPEGVVCEAVAYFDCARSRQDAEADHVPE
jgi:hypothetical protein